METIRFDLETITPMFTSGADQRQFELRPPSVKGLMRFWWRAYYWGKNSNDISSEKLLNQMKEKEGKIFGTASGKKPQKSGFSIRITPSEMQGTFEPFPKRLVNASSGKRTFPINILEYLAYGTYEYQKEKKKNVFIRKYLPVNTTFSVLLNISDKITDDVIMSFYWLSFFGAIGAKSRNGFGNFAIKKIQISETGLLGDITFTFPSKAFLEETIQNQNIPDFTAFSKNMEIFKLKRTCKSWDECLAELGEIYRLNRGKLDEPHRCENRQYIGAPITVQSRIGGRRRTDDRSFLERRAKPYFIRVVEPQKDSFDGYMIYMPSSYCAGLDKDRNDNRIRHNEVNEQFTRVCKEFNAHLVDKMEKIL